jgi:hypothetical protein
MNTTITLFELIILTAVFILAYALIKTIIQSIKTK